MVTQAEAAVRRPGEGTARPRAILTKVFYGLGSVAFGVKDNGFQVLLLLFYNQALGLDARLAGAAILIALVVDAAVDPVIGYMSDRLRSPWGRRHPFMYAAALPVALSYLLLFSPPAGLGQAPLFAYLLVVSILVRILIAVYEIPSQALVAELTAAYDERTSFIAYRYFFGWIGGLTMSILAFSVFLRGGAQGTTALTRQGYAHYGDVAAIIMFTAILVSSLGTQRAVRPLEAQVAAAPPPPRRRGLYAEVWTTIGSPSALSAIAAGVLMLLATGLYFALGTYFNIYGWRLSPAQISSLISTSFIAAAVGLVLAPWLSARLDKRGAAWLVGVLLLVLVPLPLVLRILHAVPTAASGRLLPLLYVNNVLVTTLMITVPTLISSMLADVVEESEVRTGRRDEGVIFALSTFMQKCASGLGVFVSSTVLGLAGFPAKAVPGQVPDAVIGRLSAIYVGSTVTLYVLAGICLLFFRIGRERHREHLRILAERHAPLPPGQA